MKSGKYKQIFNKVFYTFIAVWLSSSGLSGLAQEKNKVIKVGAERTELYLTELRDKNIVILGNQTSLIQSTHLVDSLMELGIKVKKVFCPEHGFRGNADAGEHVKNYLDKKTGLPVVSLYGNNKKPNPADLKGIDVVVFDLQDVGVRYYTYISSMHYMMEACAESKIPMLILDRPNPNGFYVDGPVLEDKFKSFVGMHHVPVVHGMSIGEYARMINEEGWLPHNLKCEIKIIPVEGYSHKDLYSLPIKPSPNLSSMNAVYLYPSLCLFEGTVISMGRGTDKPFQVFGHPHLKNTNFDFTPRSISGASKNPPYKGEVCKGFDLSEYGANLVSKTPRLNLQWLIFAYNNIESKEGFFNNFFNNLAGNAKLKEQIVAGLDEAAIRKTWEKGLLEFKEIRKKYLLYPDFE